MSDLANEGEHMEPMPCWPGQSKSAMELCDKCFEPKAGIIACVNLEINKKLARPNCHRRIKSEIIGETTSKGIIYRACPVNVVGLHIG